MYLPHIQLLVNSSCGESEFVVADPGELIALEHKLGFQHCQGALPPETVREGEKGARNKTPSL